MDLDTENRLAALLMEEARKQRIQADKEGVHVYLQKPDVRFRPNSRFLTATVLGVQQANRVVEVGEMWRAREKELELDTKLKSKSKDRNRYQECHSDSMRASSSTRQDDRRTESGLDYTSDDVGLRDEDIEMFLHSRAKRGRGAIGSRMDEPGPYMPPTSSGQSKVSPETREKEEWERRIHGPEKPSFMKWRKSQEDIDDTEDVVTEKTKKHRSKSRRSEKEETDKSKRKKKCSKHRHKRRRED